MEIPALLVAALVLAVQPAAAQPMRVQAARAGPILLDGRCDEPAWVKATPTVLGEGLSMLAVADRDTVTTCWRFPVQTLGLDLYIEDAQGALHDLHISAQTGERTRTAQGWPEWTGFGQHHGWYAPPFAFSGFKTDDGGVRRIVFAPQPSRELQLTKARFGPGPWRVMVEAQVMTPDAKIDRYPAKAFPDDPATWGILEPGQ
ncbi:hypothetical protein ASD79_03155 [Caulobacter sp. Root655]|uniref:hypothetical protein n=1 Tax=Caulobacter sp. Root655 TaxID=1736578 RepID=UPI0006FCD1F9|nr:hypothetical protein [Caulobacter sp. Root655]KRA66292.1 hypothetical protein ASD79_03155 [Caulobacter sp. Root655]